MTRLLVNVSEAAETLAMSRASLYRLIRRGEISVIKIGGMTRLETNALEDYVRRLRRPSEFDVVSAGASTPALKGLTDEPPPVPDRIRTLGRRQGALVRRPPH